jgi:hypothetical protein
MAQSIGRLSIGADVQCEERQADSTDVFESAWLAALGCLSKPPALFLFVFRLVWFVCCVGMKETK